MLYNINAACYHVYEARASLYIYIISYPILSYHIMSYHII